MTIQQAVKHLINSDSFKDVSKQKNAVGGKYRMFETRFKRKELKNGAAIDFLLEHGYIVEIKTS